MNDTISHRVARTRWIYDDEQVFDHNYIGESTEYREVLSGDVVAVPERRVYCGDNERDEYFACGWNACLAEIKRLNPERTNG